MAEVLVNRMTLASLGIALLGIGVFCPLITLPIVGEMNYFQNGEGDGTIILVLAAISAALLVSGHIEKILWTGIASGCMTTFTLYQFQSKIWDMQAEMERTLGGNPFRGIADLAMNSIQLQWGWAVLYAGVGCLLAAGTMKEPEPHNA